MKILALFSSLLITIAAEAAPLRVHLVHVAGERALTYQETIDAWDSAKEYLTAMGVSPALSRVTFIKDQKPQWNSISDNDQVKRLYYYRQIAIRRSFHRSVDVVHFIFPPMQKDGASYFGGRAIGYCERGNNSVSISNAGRTAAGVLRSKMAIASIAHEIGHTLGARHTVDVDLMNTGAPSFVDRVWPLPVALSTFNEVKSCQQKRKARRKAARKAASSS